MVALQWFARRRTLVFALLLVIFAYVQGMLLPVSAVTRAWLAGCCLCSGLALGIVAVFVRYRVLPPLSRGVTTIRRLRHGSYEEPLPRIQARVRELADLEAGLHELQAGLLARHGDWEASARAMAAAEKMAAVGEIAAGIAHEINNPLDSVMEYTRLLAASASLDKREKKYLPMMRECLNHMSSTIRGLLVFANERSPDKIEPCLLPEILQKTAFLAEGKLSMRRVSLQWDLGKPCRCHCSPDGLVQVLLNLILNSAHAVSGVDKGIVRCSTRCTREWIYLSIDDNGPGVDEAIRERIFAPFFSTREVGQGTGLGLAISRRIVREAGGELSLDGPAPELGGARFTIKLRRVECDCTVAKEAGENDVRGGA